jgi:acetyl esterase
MPEPRQQPLLMDRIRGAAGRRLDRLPNRVRRLLSRRSPIVIDGQTFDPTLQLLLALRPEHGGLMDAPVAESRARLRREVLSLVATPTPVGAVHDLEVRGAAGQLAARHYAPEGAGVRPLLVYFHGGGFVLGDIETHDEACRVLCRHSEHHVLSIGYRLAPEHPFPAPLEDAVAAFRWAAVHANELGADPTRVAVGGDSAGGTLSAVVAQVTAPEAVRPLAQLLIYPAADRSTPRPSHRLFDRDFFLSLADRDAFYGCYIGGSGTSPDDPRISPLRAPDLSNLPPALLVVAGFDILRDEGEAYAQALAAAGTTCEIHREPSLGHGFANLTPVSASANRAMVTIATRWADLVARSGPARSSA